LGRNAVHSNTIFGFLVLAFFIHITAQGKLPRYMGFFVGAVGVAPGTPRQASSAPGTGNAASSVAFPGLAPGVSTIVQGAVITGSSMGAVFDWFGSFMGAK
jgi:hypothetical protein